MAIKIEWVGSKALMAWLLVEELFPRLPLGRVFIRSSRSCGRYGRFYGVTDWSNYNFTATGKIGDSPFKQYFTLF